MFRVHRSSRLRITAWIFIIAVALSQLPLKPVEAPRPSMPFYKVVGRRSKSRIAVVDTEGCLKFAAFRMTQGGDKEGRTRGLSVLWPSWIVLPAMICVVPRSSSPNESASSKPPACPRLPLLLLFFFLPFRIGFFRGLRSMFFVIVVGVVLANRCSSEHKIK